MIVEAVGRIRRELLVKGKSSRRLPATVRKVPFSGGISFEYEREGQSRPKLRSWSADPDRLLRLNVRVADVDPRLRRFARP